METGETGPEITAHQIGGGGSNGRTRKKTLHARRKVVRRKNKRKCRVKRNLQERAKRGGRNSVGARTPPPPRRLPVGKMRQSNGRRRDERGRGGEGREQRAQQPVRRHPYYTKPKLQQAKQAREEAINAQ